MNGQCERVEGLIMDYALGELGRPEIELVEEHVGSCPRCSKAMGEVRQIVSALSHQEIEEPSAAVCESVREAVREKVLAPRKSFSVVTALAGSFVRRPVLAGASAVAVAAAVTLLFVVPALRAPEKVSGKPTESVGRGPEKHETGIRPARKFGDYLSDSRQLMALLTGPDARQALAAKEWDFWVADAMVLQNDKSLEAHRALLSDLEKFYREILECHGDFGEEQIAGIGRLISEMNLIERTKEALDLER